ncbi:hypothetical protein AK812_SmicGene23059 [Symbiodinium microadriaticum]|uniref:Uncharacterized protein n=1 Tax=Symbiodinium microadriaticum TaxID=2951 RepID=A0A1Q9DI63_SYMMI|nr:hypothetical protein AK812_SmicGene23059 [Symbiodinium microadriaticum]
MPPLKKPAALAAKAKAKGTKKEEAVLKKPAAKEADKEGGKGKGRALSIDKWLEALRPYSLTVADIEKLKPGEELTCYVFDRNVGDMCFHEDNQGRANACRPVNFFRNCTRVNLNNNRTPEEEAAGEPWRKISYSMYGSMEGEGPDFTETLDICVDGNDLRVKPDGKVTGGAKMPKHWSQLPKDAAFFCRGPVIPEDRVEMKSHPDVYWQDSDEED